MKAIAAIVAALLALAIAAWAKIRRVTRERDQARADRERAELERDAAGGRAATAEAQRDVDADVADRREAGHRIPKEIDRAAAPTLDPATRRARLRAWVRARLARDAGPYAGGGEAARVLDDGRRRDDPGAAE